MSGSDGGEGTGRWRAQARSSKDAAAAAAAGNGWNSIARNSPSVATDLGISIVRHPACWVVPNASDGVAIGRKPHAICYAARVARVDLEPGAPRFADATAG
jgi:hypothetical protein